MSVNIKQCFIILSFSFNSKGRMSASWKLPWIFGTIFRWDASPFGFPLLLLVYQEDGFLGFLYQKYWKICFAS